MNKKLLKIIQALIKYTVGVGLLSKILHVFLLLIGINEPFTEWFFGFSLLGFIMLMCSSYALRLCSVFRFALVYNFLVDQCTILQRNYHLFGESQIPRMIVLGIGITLAILIFINNKYECIK